MYQKIDLGQNDIMNMLQRHFSLSLISVILTKHCVHLTAFTEFVCGHALSLGSRPRGKGHATEATCIRVIPCQINAKNGRPPQISTKLGLQVEPHDLLAHSKFWPPKLCGFYFTALRKLDFSCIFAVPDHTKQTVFLFCYTYADTSYVKV